MPITSVTKNADTLAMTIVADFPVPLRRLWDDYADPRQLEKFWGPPQRPATFTRHDFHLGGRSAYVMRRPNGEFSAGYWQFEEVQEPRRFAVVDGFAREDGEPNDASPSVRMEFEFEETPGGSRLVTTTYFNSADELEQLLEMGMEEGTTGAMGQVDDVLADLQGFPPGAPPTPRSSVTPKYGFRGSSGGTRNRCGRPTTIQFSCSAGCSGQRGGACPCARSQRR